MVDVFIFCFRNFRYYIYNNIFHTNDKENVQFILEPKPSDIYEIKVSNEEYTLYKVDYSEGNMVYIFENKYSVSKKAGLYKLHEKEFVKQSYPVSITSLKHMVEEGEIIDVIRD